MKKVKIEKVIILIISAIIIAILLLHQNPLADVQEEWIKKGIAIVIDLTITIVLLRTYQTLLQLIQELLQNRRLIWKLSKNDFKTKYAGSYLGVIWAFVQPVVTIVLYAVVFGILMPSKAEMLSDGNMDIPFILYLTAGLVPWLYFSEALTSGTTSFKVYNYLVKKVVFKVSILPIIRVISSAFVHLAFIVLIMILNISMGNYPSIYWLQILYFSFCTFVFTLALTYATSSIVVFFKDLNQLIGIFLQVGIWATPIMWYITSAPESIHTILKLNPMFYIVDGYRNALFEHTWFWNDFYSTMYFWIITATLSAVGILIFKRLKPHFADVL